MVLVDESQDSGPWASVFAFEEDRAVRAALAHYIGVIDALQELRVAKGVATPGDIEKIKETARAKREANNHRFFEVDDIDVG